MAANRNIRVGTVLGFTSARGVPAYLYVARRPKNANYGLGYVFVAADVDLDAGLVADDAVTCCRMGFKDTVGDWPVLAQQDHNDGDWPIPKMYMVMPGLEGRVAYRLDTIDENIISVPHRESSTAEAVAGRPRSCAFQAGAVPYYLDEVLGQGRRQFRDMPWWQALRAGDPRETD